ncbi:response regulator transcription factor [Cryptosporangium aurantiacum]|uniref:Two-component system, OmpR family, phosphate regulon response regulator PhoB n=1 Tax=Cryptosporangium aurantiacum TaxID=134849 RepID=A0A1M7RKT7_9ACTN|nr:response regulator [Cryptosporangium aurantiacum]SHN46760.1 two-component system, OmpR family, phosphate regulon response regulator PhoB [Cryptosporangium aurantiacum]
MATIVLGENEPDIAFGVELLFARAGHRIRLTTTGPDTLASIQAQPPDLIVMNPSLPHLDGLEICQRVRDDPALAHLPILLLSARYKPAEVAAARAAGANDYLGKPFNNRDLLARAESLLAAS